MPEISRLLGVVIQISGLIMPSCTFSLRVKVQVQNGAAPRAIENRVTPAFLEMGLEQPQNGLN